MVSNALLDRVYSRLVLVQNWNFCLFRQLFLFLYMLTKAFDLSRLLAKRPWQRYVIGGLASAYLDSIAKLLYSTMTLQRLFNNNLSQHPEFI